MIQRHIEDLLKKPEKHRKKVTYGLSAGITLVIAVIWVSTFSHFHNINNLNKQGSANTAAVATAYKPESKIKQGSNTASVIQGIRKALGIKNSTNATGTLEYVPD